MIRRIWSISAMLLMLGGMTMIAWWLTLEARHSQRQSAGVDAFRQASASAATPETAPVSTVISDPSPAPTPSASGSINTPASVTTATEEVAPPQATAAIPPTEALADEWMARNAAIDRADWSPKREQLWASLMQTPPLQPIALLDIDAVDLEVAVFPGATDETMDLGVGHITGTTKIPLKPDTSDTNIGLAGHRDGYFRNLQHIETGHVITLQDLSGQMSRYTVTETQIVNPEDVNVLYPKGDNRLTLVTCYPFYFVGHAPQRFIVSAVREEPPPAAADPAS